ncbi:MAG: STAS domain-containing protein [bacterium]|nr:STAS domain-containing protein [bacterium]
MNATNALRKTSYEPASTVILKWNYDECTHLSVNAFDRLSKQAARHMAQRIVLDMSGCSYVSIAGMRVLMEWAGKLSENGRQLRIAGLSRLQSGIFTLSGLDWILVDKN